MSSTSKRTPRSNQAPQAPTQGRPGSAERREKIAAARAREAALTRRRRAVVIAGLVAGVLLLAGLVGYAVQSSRDDTGEVVVPATATGTDNGIAVGGGTGGTGGGIGGGGAGAPVTLDFYEDFQCPVCKQLEDTSGKTIAGLIDSGKVKAVYHMMSFLGPESVRAANASAAAAQEGKFKEFHDILYANQPPERSGGYQNDTLIELGRQVGLTSAAFADAVNAGTYRGYVAKVDDDASRRGVTGTPTVFLNGRQLTGPELLPDGITAAVAAAAPAK